MEYDNTSMTEVIEEVDTRGEEDGNEGLSYREWIIKKIGQPWNVPINILDPLADLRIKIAGQDARKLEELRRELYEK